MDFIQSHYSTCLDIVKQNIDYLKNKEIIDVGSNIGLFAKAIAETVSYSHIHLFEPSKEYFEESKKILKDHSNITFNNLGLSNIEDTLTLYKSRDHNIGWNTLYKKDPFQNDNFFESMESESIQVVRLDDYYKDTKSIGFIKIDVEGYERYVLEGAWELIQKFKPYILIEVSWGNKHPDWNLNKKTYEKLFALGYERVDLDNLNQTQDILFKPKMTNKLPVSIGILSWHSDETLRNTLISYKKNGLFDIVNDVTILFQESTERDKEISNQYNVSTIFLEQNIGIDAAFMKLAENTKSEYIMLLEHDWELTENKETTYERLSSGIDLLKNGYSCIRYRHRKNPGHPLFTRNPYEGKELEFYDVNMQLSCPHLLDSVHWIEYPDKQFPDKIQKYNDYYITTSRWGNWTNNPCLYQKDFFIKSVSQFPGTGIELELNISRWWASQKFKVAHGEGLFTHNDIEKYGFMNYKNIAVFYHLYIPDLDTSWIWWVEEQMNLLKFSGLSDVATVYMCITVPTGLSNSINDLTFDEMVVKYIKDDYPFVNILNIRGTQEENLFEGQTLHQLHQYCLKNDGYVFYFHNKGMSSYSTHIPYGVKDWRHYMQYFNVEKWKDCVEKLDEGYDCVGVNWIKREDLAGDVPSEGKRYIGNHFAGNFWWARNEYIRKLPDPLKIDEYVHISSMMDFFKTYRYAFELWIGDENTKYYSFHQTKTHHYLEQFPREKYALGEIKEIKEIKQNITNLMQEVGSQNNFNWRDHIHFARWLVERKKPKTIVDLGVDYGYSTFCFALPKVGTVYGIDSFDGDKHAGIRDTYEYVIEMKDKMNLNNINIIKGYFDYVAKTWNKEIDILHIDGLHTYEAVKNDFDTWIKFLKEDGVLLMHDTCVYEKDFGVHQFFDSITSPKLNFKISNGLGVVTNNVKLLEEIRDQFKDSLDERY